MNEYSEISGENRQTAQKQKIGIFWCMFIFVDLSAGYAVIGQN